MVTLLIEPFGGMAGDMFLAALLDLGDPRFTLEHLRELAEALIPGEASLLCSRVHRGAFEGSLLEVSTHESEDPPHRHLADLEALVEKTSLPAGARRRSLAILRRLAEAEARVHGIEVEAVHFHEVGAVDTLIDVCGAALALECLGVERVLSTPPLTGEGSVRCAHGELPVPPPAVVELMRGRPLRHGGGDGERLTPTGAAILAECVSSFEMGGTFTVLSIGHGAGRREPAAEPANLVRVRLAGDSSGGARRSEAWLLEVHLDDATGEELGWCQRALREAGALDCWCTPVQMKKDRPGALLSALCRLEQRETLEAVVFEHTPTLGLRWTRLERTECAREERSIELGGVRVRVKLRQRPDYPGRSPFGERDIFPEYEDLVVLAAGRGLTLREAERRVIGRVLGELE